MMAIISLVTIILISLIVNRVATVALVHTGLSKAAARFQARSAFSGAGFTTIESESVVNHPVRRRIISQLMLVGNAGLVTSVTSLIFTFMGVEDTGALIRRIEFLALGLGALWLLASSRWVERRMSRLIERLLKRYSTLDIQDYTSLLHLKGDYKVYEIEVEPDFWVAGKTLLESHIKSSGVQVLGVERGLGDYHGAPGGEFRIRTGDVLVVYGKSSVLARMDWKKGEVAPAGGLDEDREPPGGPPVLDPTEAEDYPPDKEQDS
ncbi:MAG: cation:proton antiporter regulatory subunit [Desulfatibacillaceae bacterium]